MDVLAHCGLIENLLNVLHSVAAVVSGKRTRLADWIDVAHIADRRSDGFVLVFDKIVYLFVGGVCARDEVVLVKVGIVRAR